MRWLAAQTSGGFQDGRRNWPRIIRSVAAVELLSTGRIRAGTQVRLNRIMYGHETIEELEVETFEWPRRLHLVRENRGMHYERALKR